MVEFLSGPDAMVLENADVLKSAVTLQILNPQRDQAQELLNFDIARVPEMAVMTGIFEQNLVSAHRSHAVVEAVAAASRLALDVIERMRMDYGRRRTWAALHGREVGDDLGRLGRRPAKPARLRACRRLHDIVASDHPGPGDGIFAQFHGSKKNKIICNLQLVICNLKSLRDFTLPTLGAIPA